MAAWARLGGGLVERLAVLERRSGNRAVKKLEVRRAEL